MSELQQDVTVLNKAITKLISDFERSHEDLAVQSIDIYRACTPVIGDTNGGKSRLEHISLGIGVNV